MTVHLSHLTPGAVRHELSVKEICATVWGHDRRHVSMAMKRRVAKAYGVRWEDHTKYEFDHLIPRELGGADADENIWPQPWKDAHAKDKVENFLHRQVCSGALSLTKAQEQMRSW